MRQKFLAVLTAALAGLAAVPHLALADAALILVQSDYDEIADVPGANQAAALAQLAAEAGFDVTASLNDGARDSARAVAGFRRAAQDGERVMILISGHVMSDGTNTWLLTREAEAPSRFDVGSMAVPLEPLMDLASGFPGQAVVMIAASGDDLGASDLTPVERIEAAQGVTVISGPLDRLTRLTREELLVPGLPLSAVIAGAPRGVEGSGYISPATSFLPAEDGTLRPAPPAPEAAFWVVAQTLGNAEGYRLYLDHFPDGRHAEDAGNALAGLEAEAVDLGAAQEAALALGRDARRQVQRNLALLGHDPKGIDGIFGPATRAAILSYQTARGAEGTGYLTRDLMAALDAEADARAAQLEREAAARQAEEDRRDRRYWDETGKGQDEAGLRAYLTRYPDGLFSDVAQTRLDEIEASKRSAAEVAERALWDKVRDEDRADSYQAYLSRYPEGLFADEARARMGALTDEAGRQAEVAAARDEERRVAGNTVTRLLVETRLATLGLDPGPIDGTFTRESRRAIRRFQNSRGLPVTGHVTQQTMVRLMAAF